MLGYIVTALKTNANITQIKLECMPFPTMNYPPTIISLSDNNFDDDAAVLLFEALPSFQKLFIFSLLGR